MAAELDRRLFLGQLGAVFLAGLTPAANEAMAAAQTLFAAAFMDEAKNYGFAIVSEKGDLIHRETLPGRAHGFAWSEKAMRAITFARRPGNFAIAFDTSLRRKPILFHAPQDRHFYGHGVFSSDGALLYATENDFDLGVGKIGIYSTTNNFVRIGEFDTFGVGPHELILMQDGRTLAVANGGIRTHPDFRRTKLNLAEMESSIALIDSHTGSLKAQFHLDKSFKRMSLRHMVSAADGSLWIGGQNEGDVFGDLSCVIQLHPDHGIAPIELPQAARNALSDYVGAVALSQDGKLVGFSSPKGGGYITIDTSTKKIVAQTDLKRGCGLAGIKNGMLASSEQGKMGEKEYPVHWDNHIYAIG